MVSFGIVCIVLGVILLILALPRNFAKIEVEAGTVKFNLPEISGWSRFVIFILSVIFILFGLIIGVTEFLHSIEAPAPTVVAATATLVPTKIETDGFAPNPTKPIIPTNIETQENSPNSVTNMTKLFVTETDTPLPANTPLPPTNIPVPPTFTLVPPTATAPPLPTSTDTPLPTPTPIPSTNTSVPTATFTPVPPAAPLQSPTNIPTPIPLATTPVVIVISDIRISANADKGAVFTAPIDGAYEFTIKDGVYCTGPNLCRSILHAYVNRNIVWGNWYDLPHPIDQDYEMGCWEQPTAQNKDCSKGQSRTLELKSGQTVTWIIMEDRNSFSDNTGAVILGVKVVQ